MSGDDYVALSPSTHTVPCSPFLRIYNRDSPAPCVPDIDRLIGRRLHYNNNQGKCYFCCNSFKKKFLFIKKYLCCKIVVLYFLKKKFLLKIIRCILLSLRIMWH